MTTLDVVVLLLFLLGIVLLLVQACGWTLGRVAPGWLGLALLGLAELLAHHLPG